MKIKVRVWNGEQMVSPDYIDRDGVAHWKENSIPCSSKDTMLFTGLKDKKGREIFEGDIVQRGVIIFSRGKFTGAYVDGNGNLSDDWEDDLYQETNIRVLGNIHANPELLKEE